MSVIDRHFLTDLLPLEDLIASLRSFGLSLVADAPQEVRRTWLDTFDWRLYRAKVELQQIDVDGRSSLELGNYGERPLRATGGEIADLAWPAIADTLPPGQLRDRIAPLAGVRALQVTARTTARRRTFRAVNSDDKTIAKVLVEDEGDAALRITIEPLRGYERRTRRIGSTLASLPSVEATATSCYERILAAGDRIIDGRQLGGGGGRHDLGLTPSLPAESAVRAMLSSFREVVVTNCPGVLDDIDTEFLHDLRVAVRRARSIVKLTGDVLPQAAVHGLAAELKWLGEVTTPTRDLDVYIAGIPGMTKRLRAAAPTDLDPFGKHLRRRRGEAIDRLRSDLRSQRFAHLLDDWAAIAIEPDEPIPGPEHAQRAVRRGLTATQLADERLTVAHRRVLKTGAAITPASTPAHLHALRKRCKELRYLIEVFEPLELPGARKRALPVLKALQDCLGEFQDSEVQAAAIRSFAAEMMSSGSESPKPLLAMGELAAHLDADQRRAREAFGGIFATFQNATAKVRWAREWVHST